MYRFRFVHKSFYTIIFHIKIIANDRLHSNAWPFGFDEVHNNVYLVEIIPNNVGEYRLLIFIGRKPFFLGHFLNLLGGKYYSEE